MVSFNSLPVRAVEEDADVAAHERSPTSCSHERVVVGRLDPWPCEVPPWSWRRAIRRQ